MTFPKNATQLQKREWLIDNTRVARDYIKKIKSKSKGLISRSAYDRLEEICKQLTTLLEEIR